MNEAEARLEFLDFMYELESEPEHVLHVAKLSLLLFDQLKELHQLGADDRLILEAAGCLHDIGWSVIPGGKEHHKASARLIRERAWKALDQDGIALLAVTARYHRQSLPSLKHRDFRILSEQQRTRV